MDLSNNYLYFSATYLHFEIVLSLKAVRKLPPLCYSIQYYI